MTASRRALALAGLVALGVATIVTGSSLTSTAGRLTTVSAPRPMKSLQLADPASWSDRVGFVEFYKAVGFRIRPAVTKLPDGGPVDGIELELKL